MVIEALALLDRGGLDQHGGERGAAIDVEIRGEIHGVAEAAEGERGAGEIAELGAPAAFEEAGLEALGEAGRDGAGARDGGGAIAGDLGERAGELELRGRRGRALAAGERDGAREEIERATIAAGGAERAREAEDRLDALGRVAERALEERGRLDEEAAREEGLGGAAKDGVARVDAARGGLEVVDVSLGAADVGEIEAQLEAGPAREIEGGRAGDGVVERVEALGEIGGVAALAVDLREREPQQRRERPVRLGASPAREGDARAVVIAHGREELPAERAGVDGGERVDQRRESALGAAPDDGVDPRQALADLGVTRRALEDREVAIARALEIAGVGRGVRFARELGELERAHDPIGELRRRGALARLDHEAPELGDRRLPAHRRRRRSARAGRWQHVPRELRRDAGEEDRAADRAPHRPHDGAERAHREHLRRRAEAHAARSLGQEAKIPVHRREDHVEGERRRAVAKADEHAPFDRRDDQLGDRLAEEPAQLRRGPGREIGRDDLEDQPRERAAPMTKARDAAREIDREAHARQPRLELGHPQRPHGPGRVELDPEQPAAHREAQAGAIRGRRRRRRARRGGPQEGGAPAARGNASSLSTDSHAPTRLPILRGGGEFTAPLAPTPTRSPPTKHETPSRAGEGLVSATPRV